MKATKAGIIMLVAGMLLIGVGIVLTAINGNIGTSRNYEEKVYTTSEEIEKIFLNTSNEKVTILPTEEDEITITYYENKYSKYEVKESSNTLDIRKNSKRQFFELNFDFFTPTVTIEIPVEKIIAYDIKTSNAKIDFKNIEVKNTTLASSNGKVNLYNIVSNEDLSIKTSNADINATDIKVGNLSLTSSNGKIIVDKITALSLKVKTSNGEIKALNSEMFNEIDFNTSNGKITIDQLKAKDIYLDTSNAKISATFIGEAKDYQKNIRTSNSEITFNGNEYGKKFIEQDDEPNILDVKTSNGRITLNIR